MNKVFVTFSLAAIIGLYGCSPKDHRHESTEKEIAQLNNRVVAVESGAKLDRERLAETRGDVAKLYVQIGALSAKTATPPLPKNDNVDCKCDDLSADLENIKRAVRSMSVRMSEAEESIRQIKLALKKPVLPGCLGFNSYNQKEEPCKCMAFSPETGDSYTYPNPNKCANCIHRRNQHTRFNE